MKEPESITIAIHGAEQVEAAAKRITSAIDEMIEALRRLEVVVLPSGAQLEFIEPKLEEEQSK